MHSVRLYATQDGKDRLVAELWELGTLGVAERDLPDGRVELRSFFAEAIQHPVFDGGEWRQELDADWDVQWREVWQPVLVGNRFFLAPDWCDDPAPAGRLRLTMHAGMAFGTGADATTQLCLEAMERHVMQGCAVLDIGTGTGILAIAAKLLGAKADRPRVGRGRLRQGAGHQLAAFLLAGLEQLNPLLQRGAGIRPLQAMLRHRQQEDGQRECSSNPESSRHVDELAIFVVGRCRWGRRLQRNAALRAVAGMVLPHLGMHRAGVDDF